ncbi:hypothetical protein O181_118607 [Austropuccinia psidii MF-1]|uniref:Uncharacterized protein n=1 Tax=Austropuccinia psidii MF-1 TaxID=1389203 RepID=A0A9Q3KDI3_9BASI|nr:hypothetical protein [Austropuccinia psidii MF-1]
MSSTDRLHQKILEMQEQLLALIKKEVKNKSSSYAPQNSPLEEQTSLPRSFRQHGSPSHYRRPMATSTPYSQQRLSTLPRRVNISSQIPTPLHQEIPRNTTPIVKIRAKDYNLWFDGKDVERFINKVENIGKIEGASGRDIARQIGFWKKDEKISYHIEGMPGYETADWDQLKVDMKRSWGTVSPEGRYILSSITDLFTKTQQEGGIRNMTQYRKFIGEYEAIITYLKSAKESIYKEMIKERAMVQALDGGYIITRLDILKLNIEQDLEAKVLIQQKEFSKPKPPEKKTRFEDESWDEVLKQVKELTQKVKNPPQPEPQPRIEGKESVNKVLNKLKTLSEAVKPPKRNWNNN